MKYKKGETLICIQDFFTVNGEIAFVKNKEYVTKKLYSDCYDFIDERGYLHSMSSNIVNKQFRSSKEFRIQKLKRTINLIFSLNFCLNFLFNI